MRRSTGAESNAQTIVDKYVMVRVVIQCSLHGVSPELAGLASSNLLNTYLSSLSTQQETSRDFRVIANRKGVAQATKTMGWSSSEVAEWVDFTAPTGLGHLFPFSNLFDAKANHSRKVRTLSLTS